MSKKEVLTLTTTLNTNWGVNGYHRKCRTGIRRNIQPAATPTVAPVVPVIIL